MDVTSDSKQGSPTMEEGPGIDASQLADAESLSRGNRVSHDPTSQELQKTLFLNPKIHLVTGKDIDLCNFWLCLAKKGSLDPGEILQLTSSEKVLKGIVFDGVQLTEPIVLCQSNQNPPKIFYCVPAEGGNLPVSSESVIETIMGWSPEVVGFATKTSDLSDGLLSLFCEVVFWSSFKLKVENIYFHYWPAEYEAAINLTIEAQQLLRVKGLNATVFH